MLYLCRHGTQLNKMNITLSDIWISVGSICSSVGVEESFLFCYKTLRLSETSLTKASMPFRILARGYHKV
jgi:hypothetical protein